MEFFKIRRTIPFMRHALVFNVVSAIVFVLAVVFLATKGLHFSIEFTGGTVLEVSYPHVADTGRIRAALEKHGITGEEVLNFGSSRDVLVRLALRPMADEKAQNALMEKQADEVMNALKADDPTAELKRRDYVGGQVGKELATDGGLALLFVCIGVVIYLAFRFEWRFAVATIIANLHDVVIILGFFAFFQWEFSLPVLAAVLAVFGYSVNESVVVFDRVRENFRKMRKSAVAHIMDASITGTISRTIITHGCTQMMVLSIFFFGGESLHYFALALTVGILFGIYSSVLVACPVAMYLGASREDFVKPERKVAEHPVP
ncbi:MAG TPA: protein translocase subunit SecF [Usitatibacter sp.]|nr:protein translocase subunit SecF [Usitatibacter sp.]